MIRRVISWLGLALMAAALAWFYLSPREERLIVRPTVPRENPDNRFSMVVLDAGHGGADSGALVDGVAEKDLTLDVVRRTDRLLRAQGLETMLTRTEDTSVSLASRAATANRATDCIFVSVHFNHEKKATVTGVETYYAVHQRGGTPAFWSWLPFVQKTSNSPATAESQSLASFIQESLVAHTRAVNRGTKAENFFVIANVWHPAVLVEGGFLTNKSDVTKLGTDQYRQEIAAAISDGISHYRDVISRASATVAVASAPE